MARSEFMSIAIVAIVLAVSFEYAYALKCWQCNSSGGNAEFCKDPFQVNGTNHWANQDCPATTPENNMYCRKSVEKANNETIISRSCYQRPKNATEETCKDITKVATIVNVECLLCTEDSCNSAGQFTSTIAFVATSMLAAFILSA